MTEIVVTDRRVIYAHGLIQRHSVEVHMDKIESVDVDQGMLGRVFDYGDVTMGSSTFSSRVIDVIGSMIAFSRRPVLNALASAIVFAVIFGVLVYYDYGRVEMSVSTTPAPTAPAQSPPTTPAQTSKPQ